MPVIVIGLRTRIVYRKSLLVMVTKDETDKRNYDTWPKPIYYKRNRIEGYVSPYQCLRIICIPHSSVWDKNKE